MTNSNQTVGQLPDDWIVAFAPILESTTVVRRPSIHVNENMRRILSAMLTEILWLADVAPSDLDDPMYYAVRKIGIPYRPAHWFGGPLSCACRKACSRAIRRLEQAGFISCIMQRSRDRVVYVQLNTAGLQQAMEQNISDLDKAALAKGLRRTNWGKDLAENVQIGTAIVKDVE